MANIPIMPGDPRWDALGQGISTFGAGLGSLAQNLGKGISAADIKAMDPTISDEQAASMAKMAKSNPQAFNQLLKERQRMRSLAPWLSGQQPPSTGGEAPGTQEILSTMSGVTPGGISQQQAPTAGQLDQDLQMALVSGNMDLGRAIQTQDQRRMQEQKTGLAERKFQMQQEAPQRKVMTERVGELNKLADSARSRLKSYDLLEKASKSGELFQGKGRRLLAKAGLAEFFDNPTTESANKIIQDINFASAADTTTAGKMTAALLDRVAERNPSLFNTQQGFDTLIKLKKAGDQAAVIEDKAREEVIKESGGLWPIDLLERSREKAEPKLKKLHDKMLKEADQAFGNVMPTIQGNQLASKEGKQVINKRTGQKGIIRNGKFVPTGGA